MVGVRRAHLAVLAIALMAAAACAGPAAKTGTPVSPAARTSASLPTGWSSHSDTGQGFAIAYPDAWDASFRDSATLDADLKTVAAHSPELGSYFADAFKKDDQLRLLAADSRTLAQGFAANVNVMISDLGDARSAPSLGDVAGAKARHLGAQPGVGKTLVRTRSRLADNDAVRFDYPLSSAGATAQVRSVITEVDHGGRRLLVELTMGAPSAVAGFAFDDMVGNFRLFTAAHPPPVAPSPSPSTSPSPSPSPVRALGVQNP